MKKRLLPMLPACLLLACRISSTPSQAPVPTWTPSPAAAPTLTETALVPVADTSADGLTVQDPMISDPDAGQAKFRLMELGYDICTVTTDLYNYQVEAAVRQFQEQVGLTPDGVLDPVTLERLLAADAPSQPPVSPSALHTGSSIYVESGEVFAVSPDSLWILKGSLFYRFSSLDGEFLGFFQVEPLAGEEMYVPVAFIYAADMLWIAQQGPQDALLQAYDLETADPVEALLKPAFSQSIHFPSHQLYPAASFDGVNLWLLVDNFQDQALLLQPLNVQSRTAGSQLRLGESSGFSYGYGIAYDPNTGTLWVTYADEIFGEKAIVAVDPQTGDIGPGLGPCGSGVTYSMSRLWFFNQQGLWSYDPGSGERRLYAFESGSLASLVAGPDSLWVLDLYGTLLNVTMP